VMADTVECMTWHVDGIYGFEIGTSMWGSATMWAIVGLMASNGLPQLIGDEDKLEL